MSWRPQYRRMTSSSSWPQMACGKTTALCGLLLMTFVTAERSVHQMTLTLSELTSDCIAYSSEL